MRQDIKGKIFVGMVISVLAFGFATGTGIFIGANPLNTIGVMNLTKQGEFPTITSTPNNVGTSNNLNTTTQTKQTTTTPSTKNRSSSSPKNKSTPNNPVNASG